MTPAEESPVVQAVLAVPCQDHMAIEGEPCIFEGDRSDWKLVCLARIRAALSPEVPKPRRWNSHAFCAEKGVCLAKPDDPASMHGEMCQDMTAALGPKPAEAATCAQRDCGDVATIGIWCRHHGRNPAEQAATCGRDVSAGPPPHDFRFAQCRLGKCSCESDAAPPQREPTK